MDNMDMFLLCLVFIAAPFLVLGAGFLISRYLVKPTVEPATLKKKEAVDHENFSGGKKKKYVLHFDGDEKKYKFYVTQEQYAVARAGVRGTLTHKGNRFISFE